MISLTEQSLIFSDNKLIPVEDDLTVTPHCYFNPPDVALMNALRTPQLEATQITSSPDYDDNNSRAHTGYAPSGYQFSNINIFKISGDE